MQLCNLEWNNTLDQYELKHGLYRAMNKALDNDLDSETTAETHNLSKEGKQCVIKKLEATESEANNQRNDATDEAFNFKKVAGPVSGELTQAQQKDKKLRAEREVEPSKAH